MVVATEAPDRVTEQRRAAGQRRRQDRLMVESLASVRVSNLESVGDDERADNRD